MATKLKYAKMSNKLSKSPLLLASKLSQILLFNVIVSCLRFFVIINWKFDKYNPDYSNKDVANIVSIFAILIIKNK